MTAKEKFTGNNYKHGNCSRIGISKRLDFRMKANWHKDCKNEKKLKGAK